MTINLTNGYRIDIDDMNLTLKQRYAFKDKDGNEKETERTIGYFNPVGNGMEGAIKRYLIHNQIDLQSQEAMEMCEYVKSIERINNDAVRQFKAVIGVYEDDGK